MHESMPHMHSPESLTTLLYLQFLLICDDSSWLPTETLRPLSEDYFISSTNAAPKLTKFHVSIAGTRNVATPKICQRKRSTNSKRYWAVLANAAARVAPIPGARGSEIEGPIQLNTSFISCLSFPCFLLVKRNFTKTKGMSSKEADQIFLLNADFDNLSEADVSNEKG